jgi:DNA-binding SARP family transcriptional activator/tetratricopeptide (TPR) repeat protein
MSVLAERPMWVELLGPLVIRHAGVTTAVPSGKQRVLLATLLTRARSVVSLDELAETMWDGMAPPSRSVTIRNYVKRLRTVLAASIGPRILTRSPGYVIELADDELDLSRFRELSRRGSAAIQAGLWSEARTALLEGLQLWRGTPLADVPSRVLRDGEGRELEQMRLQAIEWRIEVDLRLGHIDQLIPELQTLIALEPFRERFHAQLMLALYRSNRQAEALVAYRGVRDALVAELGVEPGPDLQQVHQQILLGRNKPATPRPVTADGTTRAFAVPRQLPTAVRHFVGRSRELSMLDELRAESVNPAGPVVISGIAGTGGIGKTTLALHWAHQVADHFADGQLYVNLRGFDQSGEPAAPGDAIRGFLDAFGVPAERIPTGLEARTALYRTLLARRRVLIVLDNARDSDQVRPLLPGGGGAMVLVTSRNRLTGLAVTEGAHLLVPDVLSEDEGRDLLAARLGADRLATEPAAVNDLIRLCDRLPLALSIVAARTAARPGFSLSALVRELGNAHTRLNALDSGEPGTSVRSVFSWSYRQLGATAARLFRLLGLNPGPDISTAALASLAGLPVERIGGPLAELTALHLVGERSPGRYSCHDLLRSYARERAHEQDGEPDCRTAVHRLLDHYLYSGHSAAMMLRPTQNPLVLPPCSTGVGPELFDGHQDVLAWYDAEHAVLTAVLQLAVDDGFCDHAWQLAWTLADYFDMRAHWSDWEATQRLALLAADRIDDELGRAHACRNLGRVHVRLGDCATATEWLSRALDLYANLHDDISLAQTHNALAQAMEDQERWADALTHAEQTLAIYRALGHEAGMARALNSVGWGYVQLGDHRQALLHCQQALDLLRTLDDRCAEAATLDSLGYAHHQGGDDDQAVGCYQQALDLYRELGQPYNEADTLTRLGEAQHALGHAEDARRSWEHAWTIFHELERPDADTVLAAIRGLDVRS